ncbi:hypothetical protein OS493_031254 [Desmophyllum pertusum]|uniref:Centromere protein I n=1 Tax=Desmophyllum pertusum TaxID=174260 RepID=A0A9W9Z8D0_9CNID|nr:hypothetical protein OS493_031254 [Desmophyllum pertusum]
MSNDSPSFSKADEAMDFLVDQDLSGPKGRIKVETSLAVDRIESIAYNDGLLPDQLVNLVKLASSGKYADSICSRLIKSLIPQSSVPASAVVIIVSRICNNKLSINIKGLLVRWILNVFNLIDDLKDVHSLYGIFFLFLESDILCPHICHLLYYLTRKDDVRNFRIRKLLDLQSRTGIKPYLTGLLSMYKIHRPSLVTMATSTSNKNKYNPQASVDSFFLAVRAADKAPIIKRRKLRGNSIPAVQTAAMPEKKCSIEQLTCFKDLLANIENIEFPSQVASVLNSPLLQHVLSCSPDFVMLQRLNFWLNHSLYEEFLSGSTSESDPSSLMLLQKLKHFTGFLQCQVMYCFTELLRNFLAVELPRQQQLLQEERSERPRDLTSVSLFVEDDLDSFDPLKTIYEFIQFVDRICVVALQVEEDHALLQHWVLNYFELVSTSHQQFTLPFVLIPSSGIIYRMLFSNNSMAVSRLCQIIVNYKKEFESLKKSQGESQSTGFPDGFQSIQRFNQYILDICDSLWRNKAFIDRDKSFCFSMPSSVTDSLAVRHMNELFSIHHHISLVGEAWRFLHQTQPAEMKLTPSLIKGRSRRAYMEFLKKEISEEFWYSWKLSSDHVREINMKSI